ITYVNQLSLPNSPSLMTSIPSSACWRTTAATAVRKVAVVVCSSVSGPSARTSGGRIILPACVVRMRSVLRFICVDRIRYRIDSGGTGTSGMQASNGRHVTRRAFLTAAKLGDVANLDGHYWSPNGGLHVWLAYDTLARYDANLKPQPQLAESWDVSSDLKQITVSLRKGVTYHSGREFTSEDVVWNLHRALDPKITVGILGGFFAPGA